MIHHLLASMVLVFQVLACGGRAMTTVEEVRRELVVGMPAAEVEAFFATHGIEYGVVRGSQMALEEGLRTEQERAGIRARYLAIIRDVRTRWLIYSESIRIKVDIDEAGRARRVLVDTVYTGP